MKINKSPDEMNADTPRTNAAVFSILQTSMHYRVNADFARQLERELNQAKKRLESLEPINQG